MTRHDMENRAAAMMGAGFNCAETLLRVGKESLGLSPDDLSPRIATCFGGGLGRCHQELCGALAGGVMVIGLACGREQPGDPADLACNLAASFRQRFIEQNGSSTCGVLLERFGPQDDWAACKRLVAETAGLLHDMLRKTAP